MLSGRRHGRRLGRCPGCFLARGLPLVLLVFVLAGSDSLLSCKSRPEPRPPEEMHGPDPGVYTAVSGAIYTDKLFHGLLLLDASAEPLSPTQAREILLVLDKLRRKLEKNEYYDQMLAEILLPAQLAFIDKGSVDLTEQRLHALVHPGHMKSVVETLQERAQEPLPEKDIEPPPGILVRPRPLRISRMMAFMVSFQPLMNDPKVRLSDQQARQLLPVVVSYVNLKNMQQQTKADILAVLSTSQRELIDQGLKQPGQVFYDMTELERRVRVLAEQRISSGAEPRSEPQFLGVGGATR